MQTRDGCGELLLASRSDDVNPDTFFQYITLTFVQESLDVDIYNIFPLLAAGHTSEVRTFNAKPCQKMIKLSLRQVEVDAEVIPV